MSGPGRLTGRRAAARLAAVPVATAAAAALLIGVAPPALACGDGTVICSTSGSASNDDGALAAGVSYITITTSGGSYPSRSGPVQVPNRVPPPCWYSKGRTGKEMVEDYSDPDLRRTAHGVGENFDDWFPDDFRDHENDDGNWWSWQCSSGNFDGSIQEFFDYVDQWSADNPGQVWVPAGQAPPQPPVPPEILMAIAYDVMEDMVRMPTVSFNPAQRSIVNLETWMWFDPAAWEPVSVTASGGGNSVTVTATPGRVSVSGVPGAAETACAGGGRPYGAGGGTDCSVTFDRSSGGQPDQRWHFQVSLTWDVTAVGAALAGPPTVTRSEGQALFALEAQAVNGGRPGG